MPCDYSKYPPNWFTEIRPRILARAGNCCEMKLCGLANGSTAYSVKGPWGILFPNRRKWFKTREAAEAYAESENQRKSIKEVKVVLTIAHLDHDAENHSVKDSRLRAYCQLHHLALDSEMKIRKRLANDLKQLKPMRKK